MFLLLFAILREMAGVGNTQAAQARCAKRIQKDILAVKPLTLAEHGVWIDPATFDSPQWGVYIQGPLETFWSDGVFKLEMSFPESYPFAPIKIKFVHGIYHPNVGSGGTICLDIIKNEAWSPSYSLFSVFQSIRSLLSDPNPQSPMNGSSARAFTKDKKLYEKEVRATVCKFGNECPHLPRQTLNAERPDPGVLEKLRASSSSDAKLDAKREERRREPPQTSSASAAAEASFEYSGSAGLPSGAGENAEKGSWFAGSSAASRSATKVPASYEEGGRKRAGPDLRSEGSELADRSGDPLRKRLKTGRDDVIVLSDSE